ncbi:MAG: hypothetical protein ACD_11C00161G0001, partial [uncultured bacterium]
MIYMSTIDIKQIERLAKLSRLGLEEKEKESLVKDLSAILEFVEKLDKADVS